MCLNAQVVHLKILFLDGVHRHHVTVKEVHGTHKKVKTSDSRLLSQCFSHKYPYKLEAGQEVEECYLKLSHENPKALIKYFNF